MQKFIKNIDFNQAVELFHSLGEKEYRARQLFNWLYEINADTFDRMTNYSKELRKKLNEQYSISALELEDKKISSNDGTEKYLFRTFDGNYIETVLLKNDGTEDGRLTVCISSQIGCAMGCRFCRTSQIGFKRNLQVAEILDQLCQVRRASGRLNNNIVFMGMGEPFNNYENVMSAADIMNYSFGFHISARKITISTCGIIKGIKRFIREKRPYNLALSLNDTRHDLRASNMPVEKTNPINDIAGLLEIEFPVSRNRLTIEYIMRRDNISRDDALRLKKMFRYNRIKLNLIPLNEGNHDLQSPTKEEIENFVDQLNIMNIPISVRKSLGNDINGACGQLSGKKYKAEC